MTTQVGSWSVQSSVQMQENIACHHSTITAKEYDGSPTPFTQSGNIKKRVKRYDTVIIIKQHDSDIKNDMQGVYCHLP